MSEHSGIPCPKQCGGHLAFTGNITGCYQQVVFMHWSLTLICNGCGYVFKMRIYDSD